MRRLPGVWAAQEATMYTQVYDPIADSLGWSSVIAALPLLSLFLLLGVLRWKAQWAALASLAVSLVVAVAVYDMPLGQALDAGLMGAAFGLFPIMWIVVNAIWIYHVTVDTGHFAALRRSFGRISDDQRVQAVIIAFCFGALLEALAGFGTPVAITAVMLIALGFSPIEAASVALVANTAPVAFGAIAVPITTLAKVSELPADDLGAMVGRQTPFLALIVPLILVFMVDGRRGVRQAWPAALVGGAVFAAGQALCSNAISVELTDIVASLASAGALVLLLRVWQPGQPLLAERGPLPVMAGGAVQDRRFVAERRRAAEEPDRPDSRREVLEAYAPYAIVIVIFALANLHVGKSLLAHGSTEFGWPGLDVHDPSGQPLTSSELFKLN